MALNSPAEAEPAMVTLLTPVASSAMRPSAVRRASTSRFGVVFT